MKIYQISFYYDIHNRKENMKAHQFIIEKINEGFEIVKVYSDDNITRVVELQIKERQTTNDYEDKGRPMG